MSRAETYSFGEWLKLRREQLRLTQRELAAMTYCSVPMIKKIEADERHPSPELAQLLAVALKVSEADQALFTEVGRGERPVDALWQVQDQADQSPLAFHAPHSMPKPATPFIGRTQELVQIGERLAQPNCRLLTLVGPGGAGKTRLALAAAQVQQTIFVEGAVFVSLAAVTDASLIPDAIARSLRLTLSGPPSEQVLAYLHRRSLLLILDNCEQLDGDLTWLSELLAHAPGVKLLATSRERLHLTEEWVYAVPELAEAAALFVETAQRVKQDFNLEDEQPAVRRICQLVENLPLAVELAASWTPLMPCAQIADHIQRDIHILATDVRNVPDRHRSIQAVFDHSWNMLSAAEQNALMRLSIFRGGWQAEESLSVAGADLLMLRRLVDKSLVRVGGNGRYDLHELVRQFTSQKLDQSGLETETCQRHFDTYLALAAQLDSQQFRPETAMKAVARFDLEQDNIRAALAWSLDTKQAELCLGLLYHLYLYWFRRGFLREAAEWALRAIERAGELESVPLCAALSFSGFIYFQGRYSEIEALMLRAMTMARRLEDPEALMWVTLTYYVFTSSNAEQALKGLHEGMALILEAGKMQHALPMYYVAAATWLHSSGRYAEARNYYQKGLTLYEQMGGVDLLAGPLIGLGQLALQEGRLQEAYDLTVKSMAAARTAGYDVTFGILGSTHLGLIQLYLGELEAAERSLTDGLLLYEAGHHHMTGKQETLAILSEVALARGDVKTAADYLQASLDICRTYYHELQGTQKLVGTPDALPIDLITLCARTSLVAAAQGQDERAVTLCSIAESFRSQSRQIMIPPLQARLAEALAATRSHLPASAYDAAWQAGEKMSLSEAFEFLLT